MSSNTSLHTKYPSMERFDLSQSQLGAFKFTPVDEAARNSPQLHPPTFQQYPQLVHNGGYGRSVTSPDIATDPAFFTQQIAPSLDNSRLRLGPAAVRAAVESASSSPKRRGGLRNHDPMHPTVPHFYPVLYGSSENDSIPSMYTSEASSAPLSDGSVQTFSNVNNSLLRALEAEQEAHEKTRSHLETEMNARGEAEAEAQRLVEHNKGLLNSIKLLQSTVKHMVEKDNTYERTDTAVTNTNSEAAQTQVKSSILYDLMKEYKGTKEPNTIEQDTVPVINLDLLKTPDQNDKSEKAEFQRTLRKQMGLTAEPSTKEDVNAAYQEKIEAIVKGSENLSLGHQADTVTDEKISDQEPTSNGHIPVMPAQQENTQPISGLQTMLELPASFLSKYARKPLKTITESTPETIMETPCKGNMVVSNRIKSEDSTTTKNPPAIVKHLPDSVALRWHVDSRHAGELRGAAFETKGQTHFRDHPVRFVPKYTDDNLYRTVMIDFIPYGSSYADLLPEIRGGTLESVNMYPPVGKSTDFTTARIVFTHELGATELYMRGQNPGIKINGKRVRVWQVLEPTYPKSKELQEAIYTQGHTRILIINANVEEIVPMLKKKLKVQIEAGFVLDMGYTHDRIPMVEFTSIEEATKALQLLLSDRDFVNSEFDFDDDYCAAKYIDA